MKIRRTVRAAAAILVLLIFPFAFSCERSESDLPVIVIPGFTGSELVTVSGEAVWPGDGSFIVHLYDKRGEISAVRISPLSERQNENAGAMNAYDALLSALGEEYGAENVYFFGYDWRQDLYVTLADELSEYIGSVKARTGKDKVRVVGHSMGGLIISAYMSRYGSEDIDRAVTLGTPFEGAAGAYYAAKNGSLLSLYGYDETPRELLWNIFKTFPSVYELLPPSLYYSEGLADETGAPRSNEEVGSDVLYSAYSQGYAYHRNVTFRLSGIYKNTALTAIVGKGVATQNDQDAFVDGDGVVTAESAAAPGIKNAVVLSFDNTDHYALISESECVDAVVSALK